VLFIGPILGVNQNLAPPRVRATAVALITVVTAGVGFGLGPTLAGFLSDHFAARSFVGHGFGNFGALCPGGVAPLHATAMLASHCMLASGAGIKHAIVLIAWGHVVGGILFLLGARTIRQDLEAASGRQ
jgi:MFS family permease